MIRQLLVLSACSILALGGYAQADSKKTTTSIFEKITKSVKDFQPDTTAVPDDKMTRKISELRDLRGGFNINEAIEFKIEEDRQKKEMPEAELEKLSQFFRSGDGKRWLDNAMTWIYRRHFTYSEIKQLVKFYKTSAGQKMAADFPVIMLESLRAGEIIKEMYVGAQKKQMNFGVYRRSTTSTPGYFFLSNTNTLSAIAALVFILVTV
jgi:uncharacterized protein